MSDFTPLPTSPTLESSAATFPGPPLASSSSNRRLTTPMSTSSPLNPSRSSSSRQSMTVGSAPNTSGGESSASSLEEEVVGGGPMQNSSSWNSMALGGKHRNSVMALAQGTGNSNSKRESKRDTTSSQALDAASFGVLTGAVGGNFGPFPRSSTYSNYGIGQAPFGHRDSMASSDVAIDLAPDHSASAYMAAVPYNRYSTASNSSNSLNPPIGSGRDAQGFESPVLDGAGMGTQTNSALLWDKENVEADDYLHDPDPELDRMLDRQWASWSIRGWLNVGLLVAIIVTLVGLFAGWPIYQFVIKGGFPGSFSSTTLGWNIGGINSSGQVPSTGLPNLIDATTPQEAYTRTGFDGETYTLVFSDEFNTDGRTFWPGDDPWWEAVDLHYWATTDLEWYDPDAITTKNGSLVITMTEEPIHDLSFRSGMLQSWNKFCFTGGYVEVSMSMPGSASVQGFWPAAWTLGNLARAGYGATNDGMWPYSYGACDVGTLPNQTYPNGTAPIAAKNSGSTDYGGELSYLPGQRASACTCPGEDHPGPNVKVGRGAPEIDINEAQVDYRLIGSASQSIQMAPMDAGYLWLNETPNTILFNTSRTFQNIWHGAIYQESMSVITLTDRTSYGGRGFTSFGYEYDPGPTGRITWAINETETWQLNSGAIGPNAAAEISQRLISEEPMYINLNLAISTKFQPPEWGKMTFPGELRIDYVRVFQKGKAKVGCDPASHPTSDYINRHMEIYTNPNETTWMGVPGNTWPKNSLAEGGCK